MRGIICRLLLVLFCLALVVLSISPARAEPLKLDTSTQFLWGDDWLGQSQVVLAQYIRFVYAPEGSNFSFQGYGRFWKDFGSPAYTTNDFTGRLYYLFMDYTPSPDFAVRLGRQFMAFTAGSPSSIMDGLRLDFHNIGPFGVTLAGGRDVVYSMDSEYSANGNYFWGVDLHLERIRSLQAGISFSQRFDSSDKARESIGGNFRYVHKYFSPYLEGRYDLFTRSWEEGLVGVDVFPTGNMLVKMEYYHAYPTFDSTSIYSVFAVDKYSEYLIHAEYGLDLPWAMTLYGEYARQNYEDGDNADRWTLGAKFFPMKNLIVGVGVDYRNGYGGNLWGFEITGDYRAYDKLRISAGLQYNEWKRPDEYGSNDGTRIWLGGEWFFAKKTSLVARIEDNIDENFKHRPVGRVTLNWSL